MPRRPRVRPSGGAPDLRALPAALSGRRRHPGHADRGSRADRPRLIRRPAPFPFVTALFAAVASIPALPAGADSAPSTTRAVPVPIVEAVTSTGYRVRVPVGEVRLDRGRLFGFDLAELSILGGTSEAPRCEPARPPLSIL